MFSANENLLLRQHKRRIVDRIEQTIPEDALDMGTTVMVMQVSCKAPGCVPLETAIIIVFPKSKTELIPGLPESGSGGSYKTKILKPMADVEDDDIMDALPPAFEGGRRTMEKLCLYARDVMIGQITQLFGDGSDDFSNDPNSIKDRQAMAEYLQMCLKDYIDRKCQPPEEGQPFSPITNNDSVKEPKETKPHGDGETDADTSSKPKSASTTTTTTSSIPKTGNIVIRRVADNGGTGSESVSSSSTTTAKANGPTTTTTISARGVVPSQSQQRAVSAAMNSGTSSNTISRLFERQHAPGIRKPGCPCCDPDNTSTVVDNMMML
eukprot:CAMPEP_0113446960 /NCGR_PEP_ID=MMETSP0014_2-20120614/3988_1 /TAXON_ID=2857 /ORGANISM="Nitzschia sp." /LENGTH=322 /DNA_ID=CAMNT_0000338093 /DNA_START=51 /DNA_END=1019 /DNA_ORIENTATION=+ /assembly_acc=CAM_ASM_000159